MTREDGERLGQMVLDGLGVAEEHLEDSTLLSAVLVITVEDKDGDVRNVVSMYPESYLKA